MSYCGSELVCRHHPFLLAKALFPPKAPMTGYLGSLCLLDAPQLCTSLFPIASALYQDTEGPEGGQYLTTQRSVSYTHQTLQTTPDVYYSGVGV